MLAGGTASCKACKWQGPKDSLLAVPVVEGLGSDEEMLITMHNDWRKVYGKFAADIARFLVEWGFLVSSQQEGGKVKIDPKEVARYVSAASAHSLAAILEERQRQEQENASGKRS